MKRDLTTYPSGQTGAMMRAKYIAALILIAIFAFGEYVVTDRLIEAREHHVRFLEQSARQRMLLQRIGLLSQRLVHTPAVEQQDRIRLALQENLGELRMLQSALVRASVSDESVARTVRRSRERYDDEPLRLERRLHSFAANVDSLLAAPAERLVPENVHLQRLLHATSGEAAVLLENAMAHLVRATEADLRQFRTVARTLFVGKLASLLLLGLLLFEPMVMRILHKRELLMKTNEELARVSATDGLTQAANRRAFEERLDEEWRRAFRDAVPLTLLMIDIDHFKRYNDRYGHQAGDECLKLITRDFSTRLRRPADFLARYGGEEFAIILPDTDLSGAVVVAEDLRRRTMSLEIIHEASPIAGVVTLSIGVAEAEPGADGWSPADLVAASDRALYEAKQRGRNRVKTTKLVADEGTAESAGEPGRLEERERTPPHTGL